MDFGLKGLQTLQSI